MKWFKHYSDASLDNKICSLEDEFGYVGYGVYWKIIEICAMQWDGKSDTTFSINRKKMKSLLNINYMKTESILSLCSVLKLFNVVITEKSYEINIPKLLDIKDNHTRNLQVSGNKVTENLPLEQNRTDKNNNNKKCAFDIDAIYSVYPKKQGKAKGFEKLKKIIKDQEHYNLILEGSKNYSKYCGANDTEQRYIKQFSTWVNQECWNDELEIPLTAEELERRFSEL